MSLLLLPFSDRAEDRVKRLNEDAEDAAICCLSEISRNKGGLIRKKPPEEIVFVAKVCYPIWLVPWRKVTLLFDGLGLRKHTLSFGILPDVNVFLKEIKVNAGKPGAFLDFLSHNINYFDSVAGKGEKVMNGLIADSSFLSVFMSYLSKARRVKGEIGGKVVLAPFMDKDVVASSVAGLSELEKSLKKDLEKLGRIVKMIIRITDNHIKRIMLINDKAKQKAENEIARFKLQAFKKSERVRKRYDKRIFKAQNQANLKLEHLQKIREEMEAHRIQLAEYAKNCESEMLGSQERKEETGGEHWKGELQKCREKLSEVEKKLSEVDANIKQIEQARDIETSRLEAEFDAANKAIITGQKKIEDARAARLTKGEEAIKALKDTSSAFIAKTEALMDLRKSSIADLYKMGLSSARRVYSIVYMPFYLACYEQEFKRRYELFPPSFIHGLRGVTKIKGVFKASRITVLMEARSESITKFLNKFLQLAKQSPDFEEKLVKAGGKANVLGTKEAREDVAKGMKQLMKEGWFSEGEYQSFVTQILTG
jgi:hypothetical protein